MKIVRLNEFPGITIVRDDDNRHWIIHFKRCGGEVVTPTLVLGGLLLYFEEGECDHCTRTPLLDCPIIITE